MHRFGLQYEKSKGAKSSHSLRRVSARHRSIRTHVDRVHDDDDLARALRRASPPVQVRMRARTRFRRVRSADGRARGRRVRWCRYLFERVRANDDMDYASVHARTGRTAGDIWFAWCHARAL